MGTGEKFTQFVIGDIIPHLLVTLEKDEGVIFYISAFLEKQDEDLGSSPLNTLFCVSSSAKRDGYIKETSDKGKC